jgi:3-deoxy-7-phosphoheptulonate synthase
VTFTGTERSDSVRDQRIDRLVPLAPPRQLIEELPLTEAHADVLLRGRGEVQAILDGRDDRLLVVVGPCSVHDVEASRDYAERLSAQVERLSDDLCLAMRVYFEKPRTTIGWKGLINDPRLDGSCDLPAGLELARQLLLDINGLGVPCASELLDPIVPQYIGDLLSWAAIGARTTESQTHREMASGLSMPVGFKNGTDGGLRVALNAMISARHPHHFLGIDADGAVAVTQTTGNPDRHIVLRGGARDVNYHPEAIADAVAMIADEAIARPVMVDCSHDNSAKNHALQAAACRAVVDQVRAGESRIMGVMLESNLKAGRQNWLPDAPLQYGISITDACIGWEETEVLLYELADAAPLRAVS